MKKMIYYLICGIFSAIMLMGCDDDYSSRHYDTTPPLPPSGVGAIAGDNRVDIFWGHNSEKDLAGYNVYYSDDNYEFILIGSTDDNYFIDYEARNGEVYYYAVVAYDYNGNESDLSKQEVAAAPRPEGFNEIVYDYRRFPNLAGYSLGTYSVVPFDNNFADFYFENFQGDFYLNVWEDTDIIDMGQTYDIYDISIAPETGWSSTKDAPAIVGHTYVIWTLDNHFGKIRITNITNERVTFDWAYQTIKGEPLLKRGKTGSYENRKEFDKTQLENRRKLNSRTGA